VTTDTSSDEGRFWAEVSPLLGVDGVQRSTMMGLPCLRIDGRFFASFDPKTGDLLVKLPAGRVDELVGSGAARPFAPAGRPFREWAAIPSISPSWKFLLDEAIEFAAAGGPPARGS
jgi:hypothetical protein